MKTAIKKFLADYRKRHLPQDGMTRAAVLIPLFEKNGEPHLLLTRRGTDVRDHQREISFPGGVFEEGDRDLRQTALRECVEELGLDPASVEILGEMDDESTFRTSYRITPFLAWLRWPCPLKVNNREIAEVLEIPLRNFAQPTRVEKVTPALGGPDHIPFYEIGPNEVWGATGRIIERMTSLLGPVIKVRGAHPPDRV